MVLGRYEGSSYTAADPCPVIRLHFSEDADQASTGALLDRRITEADLPTAPTYSAVDDETTFTLPYEPGGSSLQVVTREGGSDPEGITLTVVDLNEATNTIKVRGDWSSSSLYFGNTYSMSYRFSQFYLRESSPSGGQSVIAGGRLQVRRLRLVYDDSSYFRVLVSSPGRDDRTYEFTGKVLGSPTTLVDEPSVNSGQFTVPVMLRNNEATIEIRNDSPFPSNFISAEWEAEFSPRGRRI